MDPMGYKYGYELLTKWDDPRRKRRERSISSSEMVFCFQPAIADMEMAKL